MTTQAIPLFLNPTAGRGRAGRRIARITELFAAAGVAIEVHTSSGVRDLEEQVLAAVTAGSTRILVAGGDGSVHEAANGIMRAGQHAQLGVIPTGTGNDFAKACAIPLDWEHATRRLAARLVNGETQGRIDMGRVNDRFFANGAGIGLDAKVTRIARSYSWPIGDLVYLIAIFRCMLDDIATPDMTLLADDVEWRGPITLASVSNGPWIGGMFHIAPMADNSDGRLELIVAAPVSRRRILALLPRLMRGEHVHEPEIRHVSVRRLSIAAEAPLEAHLDGEMQQPTAYFDIEILPAALDLL